MAMVAITVSVSSVVRMDRVVGRRFGISAVVMEALFMVGPGSVVVRRVGVTNWLIFVNVAIITRRVSEGSIPRLRVGL